MLKQIHKGYALLLLALIALAVFSFTYKLQIKSSLIPILQFEHTYWFVCISFILEVVHKIKYKSLGIRFNTSFSDFKIPFEALLSYFQNPMTLACSWSLLKGLCLQYFFKKLYFPYFGDLELTFILLITTYLLINTVVEHITLVKGIVLETEAPSLPQSVDQMTSPS